MKNKIKIFLILIFVLAALTGVCFFVYKTIVFAWHLFSMLDPALAAGIIAASATIVASIIGSIIAVLIAKHLEQKAYIRNEHRKQITPIYEEFIKTIFEMLFADTLKKEKITQEQLVEMTAEFINRIIVWGSDDVIRSYTSFKKISAQNIENPGPNIVFAIENLLLAIRKDLGHTNKGLKDGNLLSLFINDIDQYKRIPN